MRSSRIDIRKKCLHRKKRNGAAWCANMADTRTLVFYTSYRGYRNSVFWMKLQPRERFTISKYPRDNVLEDREIVEKIETKYIERRRHLLRCGTDAAVNFIREAEQ